ncbi:uncharacterized protein F4822DRAFT_383740 [Hypoxylon trugodes]|uniref:uncharacterized protein n=1 Tax=Hypoxylon trugodes TaxID=326681 RepID=UPI00219376BD|nr:uncharacterized protein F4822DRAFT_383740 [Hypoxylon trugodes]KAI1393170.1 hypothetical protein F4822DRAFT_383740 [Hypoxylon trugodes]
MIKSQAALGQQQPWHDIVLKTKYNDPLKLKSSLDSMYGKGKYRVKVRANRYILQLPEQPQRAQIVEIENTIHSHYNG